ncbi:MAG: hypothetical protein R3F43_15845 [bacterium]
MAEGEAPEAAAMPGVEEVAVRVPASASGPSGAGPPRPTWSGSIETRFFAAWADDLDPQVTPTSPGAGDGGVDPARRRAGGLGGGADAAGAPDAGSWRPWPMAPPTTRPGSPPAPGPGQSPGARAGTAHIDVFPVRTPTLPPATHTGCYVVGAGACSSSIRPRRTRRSRRGCRITCARIAAGARAEGRRLDPPPPRSCGQGAGPGRRSWGSACARPRRDGPAGRLRRGRSAGRGAGAGGGDHALDVLHTPATRRATSASSMAPPGRPSSATWWRAWGPSIEPGDGDMAGLRQLARLEALDLKALLPLHGPPWPTGAPCAATSPTA